MSIPPVSITQKFDSLPEILPLVFRNTESYVTESFVSKTFHQQAHDENLHRYFYYQFCSILGVTTLAFERLIQAEITDSYFVKVGKSITFLNQLRDRTKVELCGYSTELCSPRPTKKQIMNLTGLPRLVLPKNKDIYSASLITLYKKAYQEVEDKNFSLFAEYHYNFPLKILLNDFENSPWEIKTNQFRIFFNNLNPYYCNESERFFNNLGYSLLPNEIANFKKLKILSLANNQLVILPKSVSNLINLEILNLSGNEFKHFPECILQLSNLKTLDLTRNPLIVTPELLTNLKRALPNVNFKYDN